MQSAESTEAQLYRRLAVLNGTVFVQDDNQLLNPGMLCQLIHAFFNQRARSTTTSGEEQINVVPYIVSNVPAMGITNLPTLQRMATFAFPALVGKEHVLELLEFKNSTAKQLLPGLMRIAYDAGPSILGKFKEHQLELAKVHDMPR